MHLFYDTREFYDRKSLKNRAKKNLGVIWYFMLHFKTIEFTFKKILCSIMKGRVYTFIVV